MVSYISSLFLLPVVVSGMLLLLPKRWAKFLVIITAFILAAISVFLFVVIGNPVVFKTPEYVNQAVSVADILLVLCFAGVAIKRKSLLVGLLSALQLAASVYLWQNRSDAVAPQFMVDRLSLFMFLLINVISGIICIFSLKYIDEENCSSFRKKYFLSVLFWFVAVMNLLVSSDNLEYFFLFFELTTLASFLLIGFRRDETSVKNALTALWMNQVGGLAILVAIFFIHYYGFGEPGFSSLLARAGDSTLLLPLALLSVAALIKGAQMPFSNWLVGAMVAPTPVSALLHSSTMVKIAPFIILRLSPALQGTPVAWTIIALTGFVFAASAVAALSQDNFKRILAHSTIALLALMIMMAAVATPVTVIAALTLVLFHGISKCMLFLNAGILEKVFHLKQISDMDRLAESGPFTALVTAIGFVSLLLPPFGAFIGKWFSIETLGQLALQQKALGATVIVLIAFGGAVLSLLYFKVLGLVIARRGDHEKNKLEKLSPVYSVTMYILMSMVIAGVLAFPLLLAGYFVPVASQTLGVAIGMTIEGWSLNIGNMHLPVVPLLIAFFMLPVTIVLSMFVHFRKVDRVKEYTCGEKLDYSFSTMSFSTDRATPYLNLVGVLFFVALFLAVVI
ncbi:MAG TPA: proton-conducting transporter membrane subunit [Chitinophagaceae bacterium]